jgi:hypothetical protein
MRKELQAPALLRRRRPIRASPIAWIMAGLAVAGLLVMVMAIVVVHSLELAAGGLVAICLAFLVEAIRGNLTLNGDSGRWV